MEKIRSMIAEATGAPISSLYPSRTIKVAAAQMGPIHSSTTRSHTLNRILNLMAQAHAQQVQLIVFPELALTTFFPRHLYTNLEVLETFFEREIDSDITKAPGLASIFSQAKDYKMDVSIGYAECDSSNPDDKGHQHYNSAVYFSIAADKVISKYRKVHLPGTFEPYEDPNSTNQLEKRYFKPGDLGFEAFRAPGLLHDVLTKSTGLNSNELDTLGQGDPVLGIIICNDRRWPEAWRSYGLQGVELVLCGYNTTAWAPDLIGTNPKISSPEAAKKEALFHNKLCVQHGSYTNSCWSINVAKCGSEDGKYPLIGGSSIVDPDGMVVVEAKTEDDELLVHEIDLTMCRRGKEKVFAFERHRRTEAYGRLVEQTGVVEPDFL